MRKILILLTFVLLICSASTCLNTTPPETPLITLINNSDKSIVFDISKDYPDTLVSLNGDPWYVSSHKSEIVAYNMSRKDLFKGIHYLQIMILNKETEILPIDTIRKYNNELVKKRYQLTMHDLDSMNWTVTYP